MRGFFKNLSSVYVFVFLLIEAFVGYWATLNDGLISDDYGHIVKTSWIPFSELWRLFIIQQHTFMRPLPFLSVWILYKIFGLYWLPSHILNVGLHGSSAFILYWVLAKFGISRITAFIAAVLFVLCPLSPEAVSWTAGRFDVWALFFTLLSIGLYLVAVRKGSRYAFAGSMISVIAALLSKENAMILIIIIPVLEVLLAFNQPTAGISARKYLSYQFKVSGPRLIIFVSIFFSYFVFRLIVTDGLGGYRGDPLFGSPSIKASARTFLTLISPLDSLMFSKTMYLLLAAYVGILLIISFLFVIFRWKSASSSAHRAWLFMLCFFVTSFLPIYPYAFVRGLNSSLADARFYYITTLTLIALIAIGLLEFNRKRRIWHMVSLMAILLLIPVYFWGLQKNNRVWEQVATINTRINNEAYNLVPEPEPNAKFYFQNVPKMFGSHVYASMLPEAINLKYNKPISPDFYKKPDSHEIQVFYFEPDPLLESFLTNVSRDPSDGYLFIFDWDDETLRLEHGPLR